MTSSGPPPGMVPMWGLLLGGPGPARLADLRSILMDIVFAGDAFGRVAELDVDDPNTDPSVRRALWDAGVIAYRRGFTSGKALLAKAQREQLPQAVIDGLEPALQQAHEEVIEEANRHVAHRVLEHEAAQVILLLSNPAVGRSVEGVFGFHLRYVGADTDRARAAAAVAVLLQGFLTAEVEALEQGLIEAANRQDLDALYAAAGPMGFEAPEGTGPGAGQQTA